MKESIITKEYINDNVRPFTPNQTLFNSACYEAVLEDLSSVVGKDVTAELIDEDDTKDLSDELQEALDKGLRKGLAYLVFARCVRTAQSVVTKYGYVQKDAQEYSTRPMGNELVADSNYFKKIGMSIVAEFAYLNHTSTPSVTDSENSYNCRIIGF